MQADASNAPAGGLMSRIHHLLDETNEIVRNARTRLAPQFHHFKPPEHYLARSIPILILAFLALVAAVRFGSLASDNVRLRADAVHDMRIASLLMRARSDADAADGTVAVDPDTLLTSTLPPELLDHGRFALISDPNGIVIAAMPGYEHFVGVDLRSMIGDSQALLMFGERAGVQETDFGGEPAYISSATLADDRGTLTFVQTENDLFADWRHAVSVNVTLFAATSIIMLVILYAYFRQASRADNAGAKIIEANLRVETALSRGHCGLWDWDIGRGRMFWSRSMYEMVGLPSRDSILSFGDVAPLLHPDDGSLFQVARDVAAGRISSLDRTFRMRRSDGDYVWMRARAEVTRSGDNELHLIGIAVDVSEQHELARRTDEANEQLNSAVENISETFVLCDNRDRVVLCNSKYRATFGLDEADVVRGMPLKTVLAKARKPIDSKAIISPTFAPGERASEALLPDGRWLLLSERRTADGGFVSIGTDVTQLKLNQSRLSDSERRLIATIDDLSVSRRDAETKAQELERLNDNYIVEKDRAESASRAKTTFLANMSHELRTPLNAILGFSEIMRQGTFGPIGCPKYGEYAEDIHQSGHFLLRLIDDILDMAKIEAGRFALSPEPADLADIVAETRKIMAVQAEQKQISFKTTVPDSLDILADRRATKQILLNLLSNAVKFADEGGRVRLKVRDLGETLAISVADDGMGIPREALKSLGRPFEQIENELTRTRKGTGLGLAIARSLVELQGGRMRIFSIVDEGTIVSIRMPKHAACAPAFQANQTVNGFVAVPQTRRA